ncbi:MAG TPA: hypothetical protein VGT40_22055 [Methylomirabilota bacterium]|nr:hypothetical protein [Methylomirabilota bacterium]
MDQVRQAPLFDGARPIYEITQIWFTNQPAAPGESSTAKDVTATLEFFDPKSRVARVTAHGQWAVTTAPEHVGYMGTTPVTDIPPSAIPVKLMAILKHPQDTSAYAYAQENIYASPDGRHASYELPRGRYRLRVKLLGKNVNKSFAFTVDNGGLGTRPSVVRSG